MLLPDSKITALKAGERLQRLADGGGLYIEVAPTAAKSGQGSSGSVPRIRALPTGSLTRKASVFPFCCQVTT